MADIPSPADAAQALFEATLRAVLGADQAKPKEDGPAPALDPDPEAIAAAERAARYAEAERVRELARGYGALKYRGRPMSEFAKPGNYGWATGRPMGRGVKAEG